jgi:LCP family protein required for cell wall assembly
MAKRVALGAIGVIALSGGATYTIARNEVSKLVEAFHQNKPVKVSPNVLAPTSGGGPETLLLVGNDERKLTRYYHHEVLPHSNEMLLVRIDPSKPTISMLSIPRELQVPIDKPDGEIEENRINAAYTYGWENGGGTAGGVKLMLQTIKQVLGITVNHVFITNFTKFEHAVDEMGCVYMTVDTRYYHNNETEPGEQYMEINLQPGYQRICGKQAREFVSNRHTSTSLIRDARDQRFLLSVKAQYGPSLLGERERFEHIFGKSVESTLNSEEEILQLLYLLIESAGKPVRQVNFHVQLAKTVDTATPEEIHEAVHSFLAGTASIRPHTLHIAVHHTHAHHAPAVPAASLDLSATPSSTLAEARTLATKVPFAVQAPLYQRTTGESVPDEMRHYYIHGPGGQLYPAYVIVAQQGELGQYYDIQGSTWTAPPLLEHPNATVKSGARTYSLYYDGEHIKTVAWSEDGAAYWIENTLTNSLSPEQIVTIARETRPVTSHIVYSASNGAPPPPPVSGHLNLPSPTATGGGLATKVGAILGFLGLGILAALFLILVARQRELRRLRAQIAHALSLEANRYTMLSALVTHPRPAVHSGQAPGSTVLPPTRMSHHTASPLPALAPATAGALGAGAVSNLPAALSTRTIYYAARRRGFALAAVIVAAAVAVVGVYLLRGRIFSSSTSASLPVAVLNATGAPGAAHRIADELRSGHVGVAQIGNIKASLGNRTFVFYPPGAREQARRVAHLLASPPPEVKPIRPQVQRAAGRHDEIVVVLG